MFSELIGEIIRMVKSEIKRKHYVNLNKEFFMARDIFALLESNELSFMAKRVLKNNKKFFGNVVFLYAPLYVSNYCVNGCIYCGFKNSNLIKRRKLNYDEIRKEMLYLKKSGVEHVLILTGEDPENVGVEYLYNVIKIGKMFFKEVSLESYSLNEDDYKYLISAGLTGVTMYQETYCIEEYAELHPFGPKSDYKKRLNTIEHAIKAGVREINIGVLYGLCDPVFETIMLAYHMDYLLKTYPWIEYSVSFPRMKPAYNVKFDFEQVSDKELIHYILAFKLLFPRVHVNISTRENENFRNALVGVATKMSAGSSTNVGGYTIYKDEVKQFSTEDKRTIEEFIRYVKSRGYNPAMVNWV
ncbi:radical SAM protein [Thermosipho ferrireducens]|uniref:Radical SAM protein n=1 Tax=Thermosipho ferrireducens TaxID=2571116 RepID=A0ABX7S5T3_9BACT|nr:radical SAM protein [Thermosipho ferrireducens]QTA37924.1 radical SAM protein [Thermosipho ferrireducens]